MLYDCLCEAQEQAKLICADRKIRNVFWEDYGENGAGCKKETLWGMEIVYIFFFLKVWEVAQVYTAVKTHLTEH